MITLTSIMALLTTAIANAPAFEALGGDIADMISKGKALVSSDTASTPEERATALAEIDDLESQFAAGLAVLQQQAPNS